MKRIITILLMISLLMELSCTSAEESPVPENFFQALMKWTQNLNLEESDYMGSVKWGQNYDYEGTLRKDQETTELAITGLGRAQVTDHKVILDIGGSKIGIDLSMLIELIQYFTSGKNAFPEKLQVLQPWLGKAFTDIIMPSIKIHNNSEGIIIHINADDEQIKERTYKLIDEIMAERKTVETILDNYGGFLAQFIPGMPKNYDELNAVWEAEKVNQTAYWRDFSVDADLTYSAKSSRTEITGQIQLYIQWLFGVDLSFEIIDAKESLDLYAAIDLTNYRDYIFQSSHSLELHYTADRFRGILVTGNDTYLLDAERNTEESGNIQYTASLVGERFGRTFMKYDLDAVYNTKDSSLTVSLYETIDAGKTYEQQNKIATLKTYKRTNGIDAELILPYQTYTLHLSRGNQYSRLKLECLDSMGFRNWYLDIWLYYSAEEYRIKVETDLQSYRTPSTYTLTINKNGLEFALNNGQETLCRFSAVYQATENGFETDIEYMNRLAPNPIFFTGKKTSKLKIIKDGDNYKANLEWYQRNIMVLSAAGALDLDETGGFRKLSIDVTQYDQQGTAPDKNYHLIILPTSITFVDQTGIYELAITENTAEKLIIQLTKNYKEELGSLLLTLDEEDTFSGLLSISGNETGSIIIKPIPKEPIDIISEENVLMINPNMLNFNLLTALPGTNR